MATTYDYLFSPTGTTSTVSNFLPSAPTTLNSTTISPSSSSVLPPKPVDTTNYTGYTTGGNTMIAANTVYTTPSGAQVDGSGNIVGSTPTEPTTSTSALDTFKSYLSNLVAPPSATDTYNKDYATSGIDQKQTDFNNNQKILLDAQSKFNGLNAQLQGLDAEAKAIPIQDQQDATGRGITSAGLAPKTADELRANALKAIPIQTQALVAQAEVAAAQGNAQLSQSILQQAQDHLDKVFQIHLQDAQAKYQYQNNIIDKIYDFASKQEQNRLDDIRLQKQQAFTAQQNLLNGAQSLANTAIQSGQGALAGKILALNPNSPTYQQDLARLSSQIVPKSSGDSVPTVKSINGVDMQWNPTTKQWETIGGGATSTGLVKLATIKSGIDSVNSLLNSPGLSPSVGTNFLSRTPQGFLGTAGALISGVGIPSVLGGIYSSLTGAKQNFIAGVQQVTSQLTLDSLIKAKAQGATFGALSDTELAILARSASVLDKWAVKDSGGNVISYNTTEAAFKAELDKINNFAKLDYIIKGGDPADVNARIMPDGTVWTMNSNGTLTQIK